MEREQCVRDNAGYTAPQRNCARVSNTKSQNAMRSRNDLVYGCGSTAVPGIKSTGCRIVELRVAEYEFVRTSDLGPSLVGP